MTKINHPDHYQGKGVECIEAIEAAGFGEAFCLGSAIKYIWRAKHKGAFVEDLKKARWYLDRVIENSERGPGG